MRECQKVAQTILQQLGGNKFVVMTGAHSFGSAIDGLGFRIPRAKKGISGVRIDLKGNDLYKMTFLKKCPFPECVKTVAEYDDIYFDQLQKIFTEETGLYTHL